MKQRYQLFLLVGTAVVIAAVLGGIVTLRVTKGATAPALETTPAAQPPRPPVPTASNVVEPEDWFDRAVYNLQPSLREVIPVASTTPEGSLLITGNDEKLQAHDGTPAYRLSLPAAKHDDGWRTTDQLTQLAGAPVQYRIETVDKHRVKILVRTNSVQAKPRFTILPGCRLTPTLGDGQKTVAYTYRRLEFSGDPQGDGTYAINEAVVFPGSVWMFNEAPEGQWLTLLPPAPDDPNCQALAKLGASRLPADFVQIALALHTGLLQSDIAALPLLQHEIFRNHILLLYGQMGGEPQLPDEARVEQAVGLLKQDPQLFCLSEDLIRVIYHPRVAAAAEELALSTEKQATKSTLLDVAAAGGSPFDMRTPDTLFHLMLNAGSSYGVAWYALLLDQRGDPRGTAMLAELTRYPGSLPFLKYASPAFEKFDLRRQESLLEEYLEHQGGWQWLACSQDDLQALRQRMLTLDRNCGPWLEADMQIYSLHPDIWIAHEAFFHVTKAPSKETLDFLMYVAERSPIESHRQSARKLLAEPLCQALMTTP